jgi:hypothetical protein
VGRWCRAHARRSTSSCSGEAARTCARVCGGWRPSNVRIPVCARSCTVAVGPMQQAWCVQICSCSLPRAAAATRRFCVAGVGVREAPRAEGVVALAQHHQHHRRGQCKRAEASGGGHVLGVLPARERCVACLLCSTPLARSQNGPAHDRSRAPAAHWAGMAWVLMVVVFVYVCFVVCGVTVRRRCSPRAQPGVQSTS